MREEFGIMGAMITDELESLQHQLTQAQENMRLIQERKSEYVLSTDIPIQLIKEEKRLQERINNLKKQIEQLDLPQKQKIEEPINQQPTQDNPIRRLTRTEINQFVDLLLQCPSMQSPNGRSDVLVSLQDNVRNAIPQRDQPKMAGNFACRR